jgi:hypothetical protein
VRQAKHVGRTLHFSIAPQYLSEKVLGAIPLLPLAFASLFVDPRGCQPLFGALARPSQGGPIGELVIWMFPIPLLRQLGPLWTLLFQIGVLVDEPERGQAVVPQRAVVTHLQAAVGASDGLLGDPWCESECVRSTEFVAPTCHAPERMEKYISVTAQPFSAGKDPNAMRNCHKPPPFPPRVLPALGFTCKTSTSRKLPDLDSNQD